MGKLVLKSRHRVLCGDSTDAADVARLLDGETPNVMMTDQPFGVRLDMSWRDDALGDKAMGPGNKLIVFNDDRSDWSDAFALFPGNVAYVWHASKYVDIAMTSLRSAGFEISQHLVWNKSIMVMGRSDYHFKHEPCLYAVRKGKTHDWIGDRKQTTVIEAASPNHIMSGSKEEKTEHPTQKPAACMALFANHSGDVYEPFCGSGTTPSVCEQLGRRSFNMELSPAYTDVSVIRWMNATHEQAILEDTGETFDEVKARRSIPTPEDERTPVDADAELVGADVEVEA